jgi:hypothetical protein
MNDVIENSIFLEALRDAINEVADNMLDAGYEYSEIKKFISIHLDEILGA